MAATGALSLAARGLVGLVSTLAITACGDDGGGASAVDGGAADGGGGPTPLVAAPEPPPVRFPATIGTLSFGVRVDEGATAGSNSVFELCLADSPTAPPTNCQELALSYDDLRGGGFDRYHVAGLAIPRTEVSHVVFRPRAGSGDDAVRLACLDVRFDGEPVFCEDGLDQWVGTGNAAGEVAALRRPLGNLCGSCEGGPRVAGPRLGPSTDGTVRAWLRADATRRSALLLADDPAGAGAVPVAWADPSPADDFATTLVSAVPLDAARTYYYAVQVGDEVPTAFAPAHTAAPLASRVRLGMGSCARRDTTALYGPIAAADVDAFVFLGDNHYGNSPALDRHRFEYRRLDREPARAALLAAVPAMAIWDDHDFVANNSDGLCAGGDQARRGFAEAWPNLGAADGAAGPGIASVARFGPVEVFGLDCRSFHPRVDDPGRTCDPGAPVPDGQDLAAGLLGEEQLQWVLGELARSTAPFKLLACGSLFTAADSSVDSWASFPAARDRLFAALHERAITGVVLASGDIHRSELRRFERPAGYPLYELVASPMSHDAPTLCVAGSAAAERRLACHSGDSFITVEADGAAPDPTLLARIHDGTGAEVARLELTASMLR